jgi:hypothetical protein
MKIARLVIPLLLLALAACAGKTTSLTENCAANAMCAARVAERAYLAPGRAERHGGELLLFPTAGEKVSFKDRMPAPRDGLPVCETSDADTCTGFALVDRSEPAHAFVVERFAYEGGDVLLIDDRSGRSTTLPAKPIFSPDGREYLLAPFDEENDVGPNNLEIWRREGDSAVLEWAHAFQQIFTEDPGLKEPYQVEEAHWEKDRIDMTLSELGSDRRWKASIIRDPRGWRLSAKSPP